MQIKDFDELETQLNETACGLDRIESLSKILLDSILDNIDLKPKDVQNLTFVLDEEIIKLKKKFNSIEKDLCL